MKNHEITLLVVEKDKTVSDCLLKAITKHITHVVVAETGEEAYKKYLKKRPDIVLTDFTKLPDTGNDFIKQIRQHEKKTRIIVMSAKANTQFFIKSIEYGVKGFLLKPIVESQLALLLTEVSRDIQLEKNFEIEEHNRLKAERERDRSEKILETLSQATALFFRYGVSPTNIDKILKLIGRSTNSSRVNLFKNSEDLGERYTGLVYTWAKTSIFDISKNEQLRKIPFENTSISRWEKTMTKGKSIVGQVKDFDEPEREMLIANKVKSILSIPIFVDKDWWGFLSLDDCEVGRDWSKHEIRALETVAYNLGAAIYRLKVERKMLRINESLENRVSERTAALEDEIAERMFTEEMLKDSEEKYRLVFENATDGIILVQHNKVVLASPSMINMMERSPKLLIGKFFGTYIVSKTPIEIQKTLLSLKEDKRKSTRVEVKIPNKENKWLELKTTKITWDNQPAFLIFATDISLQVSAENDLKQLNKNLEKRVEVEVKIVKEQQLLLNQKSKLESLGELSAGLAHEINQPLLGISMGLDNILMASQEKNFSAPYVTNKVDVLFKDIDRIKQIIEHVRTFSRGQESKANKKIEINELIRNTLILTNKIVSSEHIIFNVKTPGDEVFVMGNPYRLEQVILNLLSNARHAVDERVKDTECNSKQKNISLEVEQKNGFVTIEVTDNGIGIPEARISKIFDPFYTTKDEDKGTGLGLSISFGIINEMNGTIEVESIEKKQTTLRIKLPICT